MSRKSTLLALAAAASLGAFALSSTDALAFHGGGSGMRVASYSGIHVASPQIGHFRPGLFRVVRPWPTFNPHWHWHPHWYWGWHRHFWIAPVVAGGVAATYATPTYNHCTCLTKQYTPEGAVVFKDVCTNEMAMNPPAGATTGDTAPLQPQQQGYLQPPTQTQ